MTRPEPKPTITALLVVCLLASLSLAACAPGANPHATTPDGAGQLAGFWLGLWHGFITPVTFVWSLFSSKVGVYEIHNNGGWYNAGFLLGASCVFGGGGRGSKGLRRAKG